MTTLLRDLNQSSNGQRILGIPQVGLPASSIPSTGDNGPSLLYNDISANDPAGCLYRVAFTSWPSAGTLTVYEDGSYSFLGAPDGTYSANETVYKYDPTVGLLSSDATTAQFAVGATAASFAASLSATSTVTASLSTSIKLQASLSSSTTLTASLTTQPAGLNASLTASSSITASLTTAIKLNSTLTASSSLTATLTTGAVPQQAHLQSSLSASSVLFATLTTQQATPMFIPSKARTINVMATTPVFTGGKYWNLTDSKKPRGAKDPDATIDITFNWSDWLNDISSNSSPTTISDVTFTLVGADSVGTFSDGVNATVFVSGGADSTSASIACKITTNTTPARTDERTIYLDIGSE